jgi:hypothetical protein
VRTRAALVNTARGLAKSYGGWLPSCNVRNVNPDKAEGLSPELQAALEPLLAAIESLSEHIREYNDRIEVRISGRSPIPASPSWSRQGGVREAAMKSDIGDGLL